MDEETKNKIEELKAEMQCPKDFQCEKNSFEHLCAAEDIMLENHVRCLEANPAGCTFALSFGEGQFCRCPMRVYISKKLRK